MKVLVTGAASYLGSLCASALAARHAVRLLVADGETLAPDAGGQAVEVPGDIADFESLKGALVGCEVVVHCRTLEANASAEELERINVFGTENLLRAARAAGVGKIVYLSSPLALGPSDRASGQPLDERARPMGREWVDHVERTVTIADYVVRDAVVHGYPVTIVYPGLLYGAGLGPSSSWVMRYLHELVEGRVSALIGDPHRQWSLAYGPDVAAGVVQVVERARVGARYILGGTDIQLGDLFTLLERLSVSLPRWHLSDRTSDWLLPIVQPWLRMSGRTGHLDPTVRSALRHEWSYSSALAEAELGYATTPLEEGLAQTLDWLREAEEWAV